MYGEYGYMEEGKLGKPYNLRLLKRLLPYTSPYKKMILGALCLTLFMALFDLTLPYLAKVAIDRYILASWYRLDGAREKEEFQELIAKYDHLLEPGERGAFYAISNRNLNEMDPADRHRYRERGILRPERFYGASPQDLKDTEVQEGDPGNYRMADGSFLIPFDRLNRLPPDEILQIRSSDVQGVMWIALLLLTLLIASFLLGYGQYYLLEFTGQHIMQDIRLKLFKKMQNQALRFFDRHPVGRLVTRATNDIENLNEMFKSISITLFKDSFMILGILGVLLYLNWLLAMICFTLIPFIVLLTFLFSSMARDSFRTLREKVSKINGFLQERLSGMRVIQLFAREQAQMETFRRINHETYIAGMRQIRIFAIFMPLMELLSSLAVALLIWYGGGQVIRDQLTLGSLVAFISYIQMFFRPIRDIAEKYNIMQSAMASTERIFEFMDQNEAVPEAKNPSTPRNGKGHLIFEKVSFSYEKGHPVLREVSFEVRPGELVAVVGHTGSGKTTLVNLAERFYDPDQGRILLDGEDLRNWPQEKLHETISLVMQDVFIFAGNMRDNISLGRPAVGEESVRKAAEHANALPFIEALPRGFDKEVGEGGFTLSAGERQLLSFARALAGNPRLLILDEATSSIDPETERLIQEAVSRMAEKRTTLVVAHRLSTVRNADRILVMHHGRLVEQGTHEELLALGGVYYKLHRLMEN